MASDVQTTDWPAEYGLGLNDPPGGWPRQTVAEIIGPDGKVHYRRPPDHPDVEEARRTAGYSVRFVEKADG